jgi:hypothetical protein
MHAWADGIAIPATAKNPLKMAVVPIIVKAYIVSATDITDHIDKNKPINIPLPFEETVQRRFPNCILKL